MVYASTQSRGFTLIELVMSLFILGLVTATVVWTVPSARSPAFEEASRLAATLNAAQDQSIISGETFGVALEVQSYTFYRYRRGAWETIKDNAALRTRTLASEVQLTPWRGAAQRTQNEDRVDNAADLPSIFFSPVGIPPVFSVIVSDRTNSVSVRTTPSGQIEVKRDVAS